ncbi:Hypothetical predicted protein [Paramuricea clavata]|uniref:Uncharacterized protein n=1 Tax=Paramuricea clavata TaxID=317549 RepID=A0A6S7GHL5_PARCT|nr:Hypothetical predicted protein [Paramuricea clavata]
MMRKGKDLPSSSVKGTSRIPKPVSGNNSKVEEQDGSKSRNLRSNSRSTSSTRPIRINRDCLKGIRTTPDRVVKRTRPFIQKLNSNGGSNATSPTSAIKLRVPASSVIKPRAPVPRITTHCCVKPVISQTTTQSTRVLRSHAVSTSSVQSSKTDSSAVAKLSTTSTPTSTRILRTRALSSRDAVTTNIPKFTWNLRRRSSVSKTTKGDETKPLCKHGAGKEAEGTTVAKRLAPAKDASLCSKQKKQEAPLVNTEQKKSHKVLEVKQSQPQQQPKKVDLVLSKEENHHDELKFSKPCLEKVEIKTLVVSQGKALGGAKHEEPASQQAEAQLNKHQPTTNKSESKQELDLKKFGITPVLVTAKPLVGEPYLEERPLTPEISEVKILGKDTEERLSDDAEEIPSVQTAPEPALATKLLVGEHSLDERPVTPEVFDVKSLAKDTEGKLSQVAETISSAKTSTPVLAKELSGETVAHAEVEASEVPRTPLAKDVPEKHLLGSIETPLAKELQATVEASPLGKDQPSSDEKPACQVEIPPVTKQKCEEKSFRDDIPVVKTRLEEQITLTTSEVILQNCRGEPSIVVADLPPVKTTEASNVLEGSQTTSTKPSKPPSHVETAKLEDSKLSENPKAELQFAGKRKCEENVSDNTRAVKSRLENEITLKTSEVFLQNCRDVPSITVADISSVKTPALVEAVDQLQAEKSSKSLPAEPTTVVKEQPNPVTTSARSKPTGDACEQLTDAEKIAASQDNPTLSESLASSENAKSLGQSFLGEARTELVHQRRSKSTKRPAGQPITNDLLTKKRRSLSAENGQHEPSPFGLPLQADSSQTMDIGRVTPAASNQSMEIDTSGILPFVFRFPSALNTPNGLNSSDDMELCDSGSSQIILSPFGINQQFVRSVFGCQTFGFTSQPTGQPRFGVNQATSQPFSFGSSQAQNSLQTGPAVNGFNASTFGNVPGLAQATNQAQQMFGSVPRAPPLPTTGFNQTGSKVFGNQSLQNNQQLFGVSFNHPPQTFGNIPKAPPLPAGILKQSGNHVFGSVPQPSAMFGNVPKAPPLPIGGFNKISNHHFTFGSAPLQTNQPLPMSGVSFNQANTPQIFGNPPVLNIRPTLTNSDGSRRKFIFTKGCKRHNVAKPPLSLNQTGNQPTKVFGNAFQPSPQHVFAGFSMVQSPTPMESEDVSNLSGNGHLVGGLNNQPSNVWNLFGQKNGGNQVMFDCGQTSTVFGSLQSTPGQHLSDHSMEESVMLPHRTTVSCFTISITQTSPQRTLSLPQMAGTSAVGGPSPLSILKPSMFAGTSFTNSVSPTGIPRETSTNISCETPTTRETSTNISCETSTNSQESEVEPRKETKPSGDEEHKTTLHKIFSSVSSLNSTCSNLSDCQSEIDALIDILSDSISNCSLEDNPAPTDMGELVEKFKTLSLADKPLDSDAKASEH